MTLANAAKLELAWRKAKRDVLWLAGLWTIKHPQGPRRWELYPSQREILTDWDTGENFMHLKARQLGFSTSVAFYGWRVAFFNEGVSVLLISKGERESATLLDKVMFGYDRLPDWLRDRGPKVVSRTQSKVVFDNGSEILSLPSSNDPARGFTGRLVIVDEWAFIENGEDAWASIQPVADIGGQIIGLSTANGMNNMFYKLWQLAVSGASSFRAKFYGWDAVPSRDAEWYEKAKRDFPLVWQLHQEYPSDPDEAFVKSGATVFDTDALKRRLTRPGTRHSISGAGSDSGRLQPHSSGSVTVWRGPSEYSSYVIGVDVAEGLGHGDYSSAHVIDVSDQSVVAVWHGRTAADLLAHDLYTLGQIYNSALMVVEANNHGLTTLVELRRLGYPKLFRRRTQNKVTRKVSIEFGFKTTRGTKAPLIDAVGTWLRDETHDLPCPDTVSELMTYVRDDKGAMSGSPHDDRVMSLAMAVHGLEYAHLPEYRIENVDDYMSFDWWVRQADVSITNQHTGIAPLRSRSTIN